MCFSNLSGPELIALANVFAVLLSENKTSSEIGILATFFSALGDNLGIIAATDIDTDPSS